MYLSTDQKSYIREHCSEFLRESPVALIRARPKNTVKVFAVNKVRWRGVQPSRCGLMLERLIGVRDVENRSVLIDWSGGSDGVYIFPFDGWKWYPAMVSEGIDSLIGESLLEDVIKNRLEQNVTLQQVASQRGNIGIVGVNKFITIRTMAYPSFDTLVQEIHK